MRRLTLDAIAAIASLFVTACASAGSPPGGPEDHAPPEILAITPDSGELNVKVKSVEFKFDEVVSDRPIGATELDQIFLISPRNGPPRVSWHRSKIDVRPKNGFRPNTTYRVTLLPGLADLRNNVRKDARSIVFSTGSSFPPYRIVGTAFDWVAQHVVNGAYIEATLKSDTTVVYLAASDSLGSFEIGPLPAGTYTVRAIIDQNRNRVLDRNEKWDSTTVTVASVSPNIEMDAIERDSTPPALESVTVPDSVHLRVTFDKALDPTIPLQPALVRIQRADSSRIEVARVEWVSVFDRQKAALDSARRADSLKAAAPPTNPATPPVRPPPAPAADTVGARKAPPPPKPRALPPERGIAITIADPARFVPGETYRLTIVAMRNLVGNSREQSRTFSVPKPPPPKPPADTTRRPGTARPPADSARPPGRPPHRSR